MDDFERRLSETLKRVLSEKDTFNAEWGDKRRAVVEPLLRQAETLLRHVLRDARLEPLNGTITLYAVHVGVENYLRFAPVVDRLEVLCSIAAYPYRAEPAEPVEERKFLALAEVTKEALETIVLDFASRAARGGRKLGGS